MLDFAIAQRKPLTGRIVASWFASFICHAMMLLVLIEYPELLRGGMYHRFRGIGSAPVPGLENDENWRTVAVLKDPSRMMAPSAATLRKYAYDWNRKVPEAPPIRIRWGDEPKATVLEDAESIARARSPQQPAPAPIAAQPLPQAGADSTPALSAGDLRAASNAKAGGFLPPPGSGVKPSSDTAALGASGPVPAAEAGIGAKIQGKPEPFVRIFDNEQQALRSPEGGLFDTKGYPLGEYANLIIERIKGKWFIPSNLRNSQGHTTIVFFIDKNGQFTDARIVMPSGNDSLDLAALNAVMSSNPFPPLPEGFPGDRVGAKFVFSYNEP